MGAAAADALPLLDEQLHGSLFTLSRLPAAHSKTLAHLDVIQKRNRPTEPPKAPKSAPFFLPTLPGLERTFVPEPEPAAPLVGDQVADSDDDVATAMVGGGGDGWSDVDAADDGEEAAAPAEPAEPRRKKLRSRLLNSDPLVSQSRLAALLAAAARSAHATAVADNSGGGHGVGGDEAGGQVSGAAAALGGDYSAVSELLHALSPSALDLELRGLSGTSELRLMLLFFHEQLVCRHDLELVQAALSVFIKIHAEALAAEPQLLAPLQKLHVEQQEGWGELQRLLQTDLCLLSFFCRTQS